MNVFIKEKESGNYYNLFDVSSINVSIREFSDDKNAIDIHIYNNTLHIYTCCKYKKNEAVRRYSEIRYNIQIHDSFSLVCDFVSEVK